MRYYLDLPIALQDFSCPSNGIFDTLSARMTMQPEFKVSRCIVQFVAIFVVYSFVFCQRTIKYLLHHKAMLQYPFAWASSNQCITMIVYRTFTSYIKSFWFGFSGVPFAWPCQGVAIKQKLFVMCVAKVCFLLMFFAPINGANPITNKGTFRWEKQLAFPMPVIMPLAPSTCIGIGSTTFNRAEITHSWGIFVICCLISYRGNHTCFHLPLIVRTTVATAVGWGIAAFHDACTWCIWYSVHTVEPPILSSRSRVFPAPRGQNIITSLLYHEPASRATLYPFVSKEVRY